MDAREQTLERLSKLIEKGDKIADTIRRSNLRTSAEEDAVGWRAQLAASISDVCGENSPYASVLADQNRQRSLYMIVAGSVAILRSVKEDIENGYMQTYRQKIADELWEDLFEQANSLLLEDNSAATTAAAVVAGAALENGLRELAKLQRVKLGTKEDLSTLTGKLANSETVSRLEQKQLVAMADVRNAAAHGEVERFGQDDVAKLIRDARDFLAKHAT